MPILEAFILGAPELFGAEVAGAEAAGALTAAELGTAALTAGELAGLGVAAGEAATVAPGIAQAEMAANAAAGGAGAGAANINAAQVAAQQASAQGINAVPQATSNYFTQGVPQLPSSPLSQYNLGAPPAGGEGFRLGANAGAEGLRAVPSTANALYSGYQPSALEAGMDKAMKFAEKNPFTAMTLAYTGANALGLLNPSGATFNNAPYSGPLSRYRLASDFQGRTANPADYQYKPRYATGGGIMGAMPQVGNNIPVGYDEGGMSSVPSYAEGDLVNEDFLIANNPQGLQGADQYGQGAGMGYLEMGGSYPSTSTMGASPSVAPEMSWQSMNDAQKNAVRDAAKSQFAQEYPNGLGTSVNVGGYGNLIFGNDDIYKQFQQNPQSMTYSQGPGGVKYVEPIKYASGGSLADSISSYQKMLSGQTPAAPAASHDVGIYYDLDPDTRYQDALTAAQIRQAKVNQRAYTSPPVAKRPTPMGKLNLPTSGKSKDSSSGDVEAASGGIMHSSLGGYAAGGNPRLLKGPGDGMSDNIPATINGRQPARLADGEFVVPADVVSHLGNGSTDAGAKQLHAMMDKVRKARTGNPKQGKEINPKKYMPK